MTSKNKKNVITDNDDEDADDADAWVYVTKKHAEDAYTRMTLWQGCKKNGRKLFKYYKRAKTVYTIYRVVRFLVHMYLLYNTLAPFKWF